MTKYRKRGDCDQEIPQSQTTDKNISEYDPARPQSHTTDQHMVP